MKEIKISIRMDNEKDRFGFIVEKDKNLTCGEISQLIVALEMIKKEQVQKFDQKKVTI